MSPPPSFPPEATTGARRRSLERELREHDGLFRGIAVRIAKTVPPNVLLEDLIAAGLAGLWQLLRRSPVRVTAYLAKRVRGAILDELRAQDWLSRRRRKA